MRRGEGSTISIYLLPPRNHNGHDINENVAAVE
jgi:hypothetical protein